MGAQFSAEFLLGYRAGHRDGFADAVVLMRDAVTAHQQALALARRQEQLARLLSAGGLISEIRPMPGATDRNPAAEAPRSP